MSRVIAFALLVAACGHPAPPTKPAVEAPHVAAPAALVATERLMEINGTKLFVRWIGGADGGPAMVLIHGGPGLSHEYMKPIEALASTDYRIISYDQRNTGRSATGGDNTLSTHAADLDAIRVALKVSDLDVAGHSWGGVVAMAYASHFPEHVHSLLLIDSLAPSENDTSAGMFAFAEKESRLKKKGLIPKQLPEDAGADCTNSLLALMPVYYYDPHNAAGHDLAGSSCNGPIQQKTWEENSGYDFREPLSKLNVPALVIQGDSDPFGKQMPASMTAVLQRSLPITLGACGHIPWEECNDEFMRDLRLFLKVQRPMSSERTPCDAGDGAACFELGESYVHGFGTEKDVAKAFDRYQQGCTFGAGAACRMAGVLMYTGEGTKQDAARSIALMRRGCDLSDGDSCGLLGEATENATPPDPAKSLDYYKRSCELGSGKGCTQVGRVDTDAKRLKKAISAFTRACKLRDGNGCKRLGLAYFDSDLVLAASAFDKACRLDDEASCELRNAAMAKSGDVDGLLENK